MASAVCSVDEMGTGKCFSGVAMSSECRLHGGLDRREARSCLTKGCRHSNKMIGPIPRSTPLFIGRCRSCCGARENCRHHSPGSGSKVGGATALTFVGVPVLSCVRRVHDTILLIRNRRTRSHCFDRSTFGELGNRGGRVLVVPKTGRASLCSGRGMVPFGGVGGFFIGCLGRVSG